MTDLITFLPPRRRAFRNLIPGALIDREVVSIAHVIAKGAAFFAPLYFVCRILWNL